MPVEDGSYSINICGTRAGNGDDDTRENTTLTTGDINTIKRLTTLETLSASNSSFHKIYIHLFSFFSLTYVDFLRESQNAGEEDQWKIFDQHLIVII